MRPVDQTTFAPAGNCLSACLASIFDLPLTEVVDTTVPVPAYVANAFWSQHNLVQEWLEPRGYWTWNLDGKWCPQRGVKHLEDGTTEPADFLWPYPPGYYIGGGLSPRGVEHAVVMRAGYIVHDPHPARDMDLDAIDCITVFVRCSPMPNVGAEHAPKEHP